jgi:hypothetical protein
MKYVRTFPFTTTTFSLSINISGSQFQHHVVDQGTPLLRIFYFRYHRPNYHGFQAKRLHKKGLLFSNNTRTNYGKIHSGPQKKCFCLK